MLKDTKIYTRIGQEQQTTKARRAQKKYCGREIVDKVCDNTNQRRSVVEDDTTMSTELIVQHLLQHVKLHTMIQIFMITLTKDMSTLEVSMTMNIAALEKLFYRRI
jgi:sulfur relay (sulfurtransferase) complex TusBCD TusD component (DsrE family)